MGRYVGLKTVLSGSVVEHDLLEAFISVKHLGIICVKHLASRKRPEESEGKVYLLKGLERLKKKAVRRQ